MMILEIKALWESMIEAWRADYAAGRIDANELAVHEGNMRRAFRTYGIEG